MTNQATTSQQCPEVSDDGITILFDNVVPGRKGVDIVFVHGLNGHPQRTWSHANGFFWPWELRTYLTHSRVMTFGYNANVESNLVGNLMGLKDVASALLVQLSNKRWRGEAITRPLVFVGHSMGGLVSKLAAVEAAQYRAAQANDLHKLYASISGFIFFGVPHGGSTVLGMRRVWILQKMAKAAFTEIPPRFEAALQSGSTELVDLADRFRLLDIYVEQKLFMANFVEMLGTAGLNGPVVDAASAATGYAKAGPAQPINADHTHMVRYQNAKDNNFQNISDQLQRIEVQLGDTDTIWDRADLRHVYESLKFPQMNDRRERLVDPHENTFNWIIAPEDAANSDANNHAPEAGPNHQFSDWLRDEDSTLFWISGKAASGKSTLMKHLSKKSELRTILEKHYAYGDNRLILASFYFYDQGKSVLQRSREGLLRALLADILLEHRSLWGSVFNNKCRQAFNRYDSREKTAEERLSKPVIEWSWSDLVEVFDIFASLKPSTSKVFLLIDGIDEFRLSDNFEDYLEYEDGDKSERASRNIQAHREIANFFVGLSDRPNFKICVAGRPAQAFIDRFQGYSKLDLHDHTKGDIRRFVEDKLKVHLRMQYLLQHSYTRANGVIEEVCSKANGIFLWVRLMVNQLLSALEAGDSIEALEELSHRRPKGLFPMFKSMMADVLPEYEDEGYAMFRRVISSRELMTDLSLSFTQTSLAKALNFPVGRLDQRSESLRADEIRRQVKSRCGGLLELTPNPALDRLWDKWEHEKVWRECHWKRRPHIISAPVITFVHRTAIEYLQSPPLNLKPKEDTERELLVSCLLRVKLIGITLCRWEIFCAVKDALFYAKRVEEQYKTSPVEILDAIEKAMFELWQKSMTAARPGDGQEDPGEIAQLYECRKRKGVEIRDVSWTTSIWGPVFSDRQETVKHDTMLTLAFQCGLILYLEHKIREKGNSVLVQEGRRPPLAYAVVPRGHSLLDNFPLSERPPSKVLFAEPSMIRWLIERGASPNQVFNGASVWHHALNHSLMKVSILSIEDFDIDYMNGFCRQTSEWAKTMSLLVDNGADVVSPMGSYGKTPLQYLWTYWVKYGPLSEPIRELFANVVRKIAKHRSMRHPYESITVPDLLVVNLTQLASDFNLDMKPCSSSFVPGYETILRAFESFQRAFVLGDVESWVQEQQSLQKVRGAESSSYSGSSQDVFTDAVEYPSDSESPLLHLTPNIVASTDVMESVTEGPSSGVRHWSSQS